MVIFVRCPFLKSLKCIDERVVSVNELVNTVAFKTGIPECLLVAYNGCNQLLPESVVQHGTTVDFTLTLPGGKGGFGSMLRAIGAQIEKTTNREACRDLSGRRLRDINEEQRLKKWLAKKMEREAEAERRHKERLERLKQRPKHDFNDPEYNKQRSELTERIDDALCAGLKKIEPVTGKEQTKETGEPPAKKPCLWLGVDVSSDSDTGDEDCMKSQDEEYLKSHDKERLQSHDEGSNSREQAASPVAVEPNNENSKGETSYKLDPSDAPHSEQIINTSCLNTSLQLENLDQEHKASNACQSPDSKPPLSSKNIEVSKEDLMAYNSCAELEELGLEKLKSILMSLGLKCGGTLVERAQRIWSIRGLEPEDYPPSLKAKQKKNMRS